MESITLCVVLDNNVSVVKFGYFNPNLDGTSVQLDKINGGISVLHTMGEELLTPDDGQVFWNQM